MRVVIAEDSVLLRAGLQRVLADDGIDTVAVVDKHEALLDAIAKHKPDLALVDVRMPPTFTDEGLRAALQARRQVPGLPVLVLSQHVEETYAVELLAGAGGSIGYLLKERIADIDDFLGAVRQVAGGGICIDPEVMSQLLMRAERDPLASLTIREREVLKLMAQGDTNTSIARRLVVSDGAVSKHISNIFAKLGLEHGGEDHRRVRAVLTYLNRPGK